MAGGLLTLTQFYLFMKRTKVNKSKERFDKWGWITWGSVDPFRKVQPSYLNIPQNNGTRDDPPTIKLSRTNGYPRAVKLILESPSYLYSFVGYVIARDYALSYDLTRKQASILIIISFHEVFYPQDFKFWCLNQDSALRTLIDLRKFGFLTAVKTPSGKGGNRTRNAYVLSALGVNFVNGYKDFFDSKMAKIKNTPGASNISLKRAKWFNDEEEREKELQEKIWNDRILIQRQRNGVFTPITSNED